jgi:hypothetical protein
MSASRIRKCVGQLSRCINREFGVNPLDQVSYSPEGFHPSQVSTVSIAPPKMQVSQQHIQKLLDEGVRETSASQYASSMFLVPKADDSYRSVVGFRAVNKKLEIEIQSVPLLDIHCAFHWFSRVKYFTTLDLNQA